MRNDMGLDPGDLFVVDEIRYFVGPEDTNVIAPRRDVERWYVKATLQADPAFAGRWLVRRIDIGAGAGVAPYSSSGYEPGIWSTFVGRESGDLPSSYPGVPGEWYGVPEDPFLPHPCTDDHGPYCICDWEVGGCDCGATDTPICAGPPPEVMGCLAGT